MSIEQRMPPRKPVAIALVNATDKPIDTTSLKAIITTVAAKAA